MDQPQQSLLEWARVLSEAIKRYRFPFGAATVVLKHGQFFNARPKPREVRFGPIKLCFMNAAKLALEDPRFTYIEGFAMTSLLPVEHAWAVDESGRLIDNTWRTPGLAYFGVPFKTSMLRKSLVENGYYGMFGGMGRPPYVFTLKPRALKACVKKITPG